MDGNPQLEGPVPEGTITTEVEKRKLRNTSPSAHTLFMKPSAAKAKRSCQAGRGVGLVGSCGRTLDGFFFRRGGPDSEPPAGPAMGSPYFHHGIQRWIPNRCPRTSTTLHRKYPYCYLAASSP